ncbi:hypothetical protein TRFO_18059 [Tritrichomonas foetus]|uniref:protein disulfide-isomerase n=1 Tax=Tritrichomonas foetus TaxID=1144522 RepID=A0A1J4KR26_9EUKA|nr:hypothetical protein TRFO_18059 [Tritrichomonas foetus]|eukprot:OHT12252.1 hypothetical protein TRFO_18059 [Tritrichomonas foetus]
MAEIDAKKKKFHQSKKVNISAVKVYKPIFVSLIKMLLSFFFSIAFSVYIPFSLTETLSIETANDEILHKLIEENPIVIALSCSQKDAYILASFSNAESLFPEAKFVAVFPLSLRNFLNQSVPSDPYFAIIKNGVPTAVVGQIDDESTLLYMIDLHLYGTRPVLNSQSELIAALGESPITLMSSYKQFDNTFSLAKEVMPTVGPVNVISLAPSVISDINMKPNECAIYRKVDNALEPFDCSKNTFLNISKTTFDFATIDKLRNSQKLAVLFHSPEIKPEHTELVFVLGSHFRDFNFFFLKDEKTKEFVNAFYERQFCNGLNFGIVDVKNNFIYEVNDYITDELKNATEFDAQIWLNSIAQLINALNLGQVPKTPKSEPIPKPSDLPIKKIVGLNYFDFVLETNMDVLVLFVKPRSNECAEMFTEFRKVAEDSIANNNTNLKFAFMDATVNQIDGGLYPIPGQPSILLYPAANKSFPRLMIGKKAADIQLLMRLFATNSFKLSKEEKLGGMSDFFAAVEYAKLAKPKMNQEQIEVLDDTIKKVAEAYILHINNEKKSTGEAENSFTTVNKEL